jgi:hypothetical protein
MARETSLGRTPQRTFPRWWGVRRSPAKIAARDRAKAGSAPVVEHRRTRSPCSSINRAIVHVRELAAARNIAVARREGALRRRRLAVAEAATAEHQELCEVVIGKKDDPIKPNVPRRALVQQGAARLGQVPGAMILEIGAILARGYSDFASVSPVVISIQFTTFTIVPWQKRAFVEDLNRRSAEGALMRRPRAPRQQKRAHVILILFDNNAARCTNNSLYKQNSGTD